MIRPTCVFFNQMKNCLVSQRSRMAQPGFYLSEGIYCQVYRYFGKCKSVKLNSNTLGYAMIGIIVRTVPAQDRTHSGLEDYFRGRAVKIIQ